MPKRALLASLATVVLLATNAPTSRAAQLVPSAISGVVVHPNGAVVTRSGTVDLAAGTQTLVFAELPAATASDALRVRLGDDPSLAEVLGVTVETIIRKPERDEVFRAAEKEVFELRDRLAAVDVRLDDAQGTRDTLRGLPIDEPTIRKPDSVKLEPAAWIAAFAQIRNGLVDAARATAELERDRRHLLDRLRDAEARLVEVGAIRTASHKRASLDVRANHAARVTLELSYFVPGASWTPAYTVRVDRADSVTLLRRARVVQRTGEDWSKVPLSLSTTDPSFRAGPEALRSWRIRERPAPPEIARPAFAKSVASGADLLDADSGNSLTGFFQPPTKYVGEKISLDVKDAPIRDVLSEIASLTGTNLVLAEDVHGRVTLRLTEVPWDQVLEEVLRSRGLAKVREGNLIRVATRESLDREQEARLRTQARSSKLEPVLLKIIPVQYAVARALLPQLRRVASHRDDASIDVDDRTNSLIVKDTDRAIEVMTDLVHSLDTRIYPDEPPFWMVHDLAPALLADEPSERARGWRERFDAALAGRDAGAPAPAPLFPADAPEPEAPLTARDRRVPQFVFGPTAPVSVPSDARAHELVLGTTTLTAELDYEVAPLARADAILAARVTPTEQPFVSGPAESFIAGDYAGRTTLPDAVSGETVRVALGPDPRLVVRRIERKSQADTGFASAQVTETSDVRIEIENHAGTPAAVHLVDRVPFTLDTRLAIDVSGLEPTPRDDGPSDRARGLLAWDLPVPSGATARASYRLTIERPRDGAITLTPQSPREPAP